MYDKNHCNVVISLQLIKINEKKEKKNLPLQPQSHMAWDKMDILLLNCLVHLIYCPALTCNSVVCATYNSQGRVTKTSY